MTICSTHITPGIMASLKREKTPTIEYQCIIDPIDHPSTLPQGERERLSGTI